MVAGAGLVGLRRVRRPFAFHGEGGRFAPAEAQPDRHKTCIDCVDDVAEQTHSTWNFDLVSPLTSHIVIVGDRVTAWVTGYG